MHTNAAPHYASRGSRIGGQLLDGLVMLVPLVGAVILGKMNDDAGTVAIIAVLVFVVGYYFFADAMEGGQSFGKRAVGTAVVHSESGQPCTFGQSFVRNLLLYLLGPIDWIFIFGERHQRLGDKLANTIVVEAER